MFKRSAAPQRPFTWPDLECELIVATCIDVSKQVKTPADGCAYVGFEAGRCFDVHSDAPYLDSLVRAAEEPVLLAQAHRESLLKSRSQIEDHVVVRREGTNWTKWDLGVAIVLGLLSVVFLVVALNTIASSLLASAWIDDPVRAYLFAATPLAVAVALKCFGSVFVEIERQRYVACVLATGILLGLSWIPVFVHSFPGVGASLVELDSSSLWDGAGSPGSSKLLIACQLLAETFLAAGVWLHVQQLVSKHQVTTYEHNPEAQKRDKDIVECDRVLAGLRDELGRRQTELEQTLAMRAVFVQRHVTALKLRLDHMQPPALRLGQGTPDLRVIPHSDSQPT
jgi:hypothetical protein